MEKEKEIAYITVTETAAAAFREAMKKVTEKLCSTTNEEHAPPVTTDPLQNEINALLTPPLQPRGITTLSHHNRDGFAVSEVDGSVMKEILEQIRITNAARLARKRNQRSKPSAAELAKNEREVEYVRCICPECSLEQRNFSAWKAHICDEHNFGEILPHFTLTSGRNVDRSFECNDCHSVIKTLSIKSDKIFFHRTIHAPFPVCFECRKCQWRHNNFPGLMRHVRNHHLAAKKSKKGK